uniref:Uncharacterized protein n=1 Tax=Mola mola TaxID=94237 RepID=A0A3Q3WHL4_MOLML
MWTLKLSVVVKRELSQKEKLSIYQSIYIPTLSYGRELWVVTERTRSSLDIRGELGVKPLLFRIERSQLRWFGHLVRMPPGCFPQEAVDGDIVILSAQWERRRTAMKQLHEQQQLLPAFVSELDVISANIAHLEGDFEEMESRLVYLETLCCQCEERTFKQHHINKLGVYKKKKSKHLIHPSVC